MTLFNGLLFFSICLWGCSDAAKAPTDRAAGSDNAFSENSPLLPLVTFGDKSYYFATRFTATFLEAEQFCEDIHMELVRVQTKEENDFLYKYAQEKTNVEHFWTAGTKLVDKNNWIYITTGEVVDYLNWGSGQPDNPNSELCLELWLFKNKALSFNDRDCNVKFPFICEKDKRRSQVTQADKSKGWASVFQNPNVSPGVNLLYFQGKSYYFGRYFKATYLEATQFCQLISMRLVSISSEQENTRLHKYIRDTSIGDNFWCSATRAIDGTNWIWLTTGARVEYFNWKSGQPNDPNELCIQLAQQKETGLFWEDYSCGTQANFICEGSDNQYNGGTQVSPRPTTIAPKEPTEHYPDNPSLPVTTVDGRRYRVSKIRATQEKASQTCKQYGMELVSIPDKKKNDVVTNLVQQSGNSGPGDNYYWTSGKKVSDGNWVWRDQQPINYVNWGPGEPNNLEKNETCLHLFDSGYWNDLRCDREEYFICESTNTGSSGDCHSQPIVNVYVNNNQCSNDKDGTVTDTKRIASSGDGEGYNVEVNNNIGTCAAGPKTVPTAGPKTAPTAVKERKHKAKPQH